MKADHRVWASADLEGWHYWGDAPVNRSYLRARHRHLFRVTVEIPVAHHDRAVEFHDLRDFIIGAWNPEWGSASCELIAGTIAGRLWAHPRWPAYIPEMTVEVSEDGEVGSVSTFTREDSDLP